MTNHKKTVGIIGASGYSGEELVRLLLNHSEIELRCITSRQYAGKELAAAFPRFHRSSLVFQEPDVDAVAKECDTVFLALPHGTSAEYAAAFYKKGVNVIDISADFRLSDADLYEKTYERAHPAPELLKEAAYGLPEVNRHALQDTHIVACPGCYPTSVLLPLYPLLYKGLIEPDSITVTSMSGVTGAGRKVDLPFLFAECNESVRPYALSGHRHLPEMEQELSRFAERALSILFIPHLIPMNRGIHSTIVASPAASVTTSNIADALTEAYSQEPFIKLLHETAAADTKHVTYTNCAEIGYTHEEHTGRIVLSSAIDNLVKGAAGQAVQCMNAIYGFPEDTGFEVL